MSDVIDRANAESAAELERTLAAQKLPEPNDLEYCIDCANTIGAKRKQALPHALRCVDCQTEFERLGR